MQTEFWYFFGYWTPGDLVANEKGYDQESSGFFRVLAESEAEALVWGHELSRWYTSNIFGDDSEQHWDSTMFASWIDLAPIAILRETAITAPVVTAGEYPNLEQIRSVFGD